MLQDWMKGRRAEGQEINGLVVAEQRRLGGSAPVNAMLLELAARIEAGDLEPGHANAELMVDALTRL
jgi:2-dehydropantoate 2-reductase